MTREEHLDLATKLVYWAGLLQGLATLPASDELLLVRQSRSMMWQAHMIFNEYGVSGMFL